MKSVRDAVAPGYELVAARPLVETPVTSLVPLAPGDRVLVSEGERIVPGTTLVERLRDARLVDVPGTIDGGEPGGRWIGELEQLSFGGRRRGAAVPAAGELLFRSGDRWRLVTGAHVEPLASPVEGTMRTVRPGIVMSIDVLGIGIPGTAALGGFTRGRLSIVGGAGQDLRPRMVDVGAADQILVLGSRIDAETLTRARAMGVRGVVVAGMSTKERRDFLASESRQRAALHLLPPFGVLVLDGALRRPIASPVMRLLEVLEGRDVAIIDNPPRLVFNEPSIDVPAPEPGLVRVRSGPLLGQEGAWGGLAGVRRFAAGTHLEAGFVRFGDEEPVALPLADLERYTS